MKYDSRLMTNALLTYIPGFLIFHFEREMFWNMAISIAVLWGISWAIAYPAKAKVTREKAKQEKADEDEYWEYHAQSDALRKKYDPKGEWNEISTAVVPVVWTDFSSG